MNIYGTGEVCPIILLQIIWKDQVRENKIMPAILTLSMLGKNFSRRHFEIFFSFFSHENSTESLLLKKKKKVV